MRSDWQVLTLAQAGVSLVDCDHRTPPGVEEGYPYIAIPQLKDGHVVLDGVRRISREHLDEWTKKLKPREHDVIVVRRCNSGVSAVVPRGVEWAIGQNLVVLRANGLLVRPRFLRWLVRGEDWWAQVRKYINVGAVFDSLKCRDVPNFEVTVPPLEEQDRICEALDAVDHRIDLLRQTNATLESIAQALFKSWFIDFDPVRAKAEGREPLGLDAATAALFPAEFEESALGVVPAGWQVRQVREVVADVFDGPHATPAEATEGPAFLGIKNLTGTALDLGQIRHIAEADYAQWTRRVTPKTNDIVFSYEAALGLFALIPPALRCCLGRRLALVRAKPVDGTPHFWFHQFVGAPFQRTLTKHTVQGATVNRIALKEFPSFPVLEPGAGPRRAFEAAAAPLWARIHANQQQALALSELRDTLLPRLISGKLRLPEAQAMMESTP